MATWMPRLQLFEIADQSWFPQFLREAVQDGLTHAWTVHVPVLQRRGSPATVTARLLKRELGRDVSKYTYVDFCSGSGGPTPYIEQALNGDLESSATKHHDHAASSHARPTTNGPTAVDFVLTDLHPHVERWRDVAGRSEHLSFEPGPVDAADAPAELVSRYKTAGRKMMRLFSLSFHHFDDTLARAILKNSVETSDGFAYVLGPTRDKVDQTADAIDASCAGRIFELLGRQTLDMLLLVLFGFAILLFAPVFYWKRPLRLFFVYIIPIIPFVLVFDGLISSLRTRTPDEVEALLRTCGADCSDWDFRSGREEFIKGNAVNWIICTKRQ